MQTNAVTDWLQGSIREWRRMAIEEDAKAETDNTVSGFIASMRAVQYENTAKALEKQLETGVLYCNCHVLPATVCTRLAIAKVARA